MCFVVFCLFLSINNLAIKSKKNIVYQIKQIASHKEDAANTLIILLSKKHNKLNKKNTHTHTDGLIPLVVVPNTKQALFRYSRKSRPKTKTRNLKNS